MALVLNGSTDIITGLQINSANIVNGSITAADLGTGVGGKVLQVKQAVKTDTASTNSSSFVDVSGLSVSITPTSASNKILVSFNGYFSGISNSFAGLNILRNSSAIGLGTGASGNRTNVSAAIVNVNASSSAYGVVNAGFDLDRDWETTIE